jgi:hypothetical protein
VIRFIQAGTLLDKFTDLKSVESGPLRFLRSRKMSSKKNQVVLAAAVLMAVAVFSPSVCQAGLFDCLSPSSSAAPLTYAPPYEAQRVAYMPTCDPCSSYAAPQVNYVPEVKYRWTYSRIARTEYQPVAAADPCSGCPVTSYRPVTTKSLLPWLHREAYTTYKPVPYGAAMPVSYMQPSYQASACNPCASTCDPCGGSMAAPSLNSGCTSCVAGTSDPGYPEQTFTSGEGQWAPAEDSGTQLRNKPIPDPETQKTDDPTNGQPTAMPRMVIPQLQTDRTASLSRVRTISYDAPALMTPSGNLQQAATTVVMPLRLVPIE